MTDGYKYCVLRFDMLACYYNMQHTIQTYVNPNKMGISIFSCGGHVFASNRCNKHMDFA